MKKLFIWDFHGTLEKGNEHAVLEISNSALAKHGFSQRFTDEHAVSLYGKKWYEYFEFLLPDEPHETHITLQQTSFEWPDGDEIVAKHMQANDHALEVLETIRDNGHSQVVVSNTKADALPVFLRLTGLDTIFDEQSAFAVMAHAKEAKRSKLDVMNEHLAAMDNTPEMIVVGDSAKDMQLAEQLGAKGYWYRHPNHPVPEVVRKDPKLVPVSSLRGVLAEI